VDSAQCPALVQKPLPTLPNDFTVFVEVSFEESNITWNLVEYYDYYNNRVRMDFYRWGHTYSVISYFNQLSQVNITDNSLCQTNKTSPTDRRLNSTQQLDAPDFDSFITNFENLTFVYTGTREARGILCDVWSSYYVGPWLRYQTVQASVDWYFSVVGWATRASQASVPVAQIPILIELTGSIVGNGSSSPFTHEIAYSNLIVGPPDPSLFITCSNINNAQQSSASLSNGAVAAAVIFSFVGGGIIVLFAIWAYRQYNGYTKANKDDDKKKLTETNIEVR